MNSGLLLEKYKNSYINIRNNSSIFILSINSILLSFYFILKLKVKV
jgi:hypothetical protein